MRQPGEYPRLAMEKARSERCVRQRPEGPLATDRGQQRPGVEGPWLVAPRRPGKEDVRSLGCPLARWSRTPCEAVCLSQKGCHSAPLKSVNAARVHPANPPSGKEGGRERAWCC